MFKTVMSIDPNELNKIAEKRFLEMMGEPAMRYNAAWLNQQKNALNLRDELRDKFNLKGIIKIYDRVDFQSGSCSLNDINLRVEGFTIPCNQFGNIDSAKISIVALYLLTCDELSVENNLLYSLYLDMWQTAYLDSSRELIRNKMYQYFDSEQNKKLDIASYGPGYFGMGLDEMGKIHNLLKGEEVGVTIVNGLLNPAKSCAGIYLGMEEDSIQSFACESCIGNMKNCRFCVNSQYIRDI